jgi:hypothetical protein
MSKLTTGVAVLIAVAVALPAMAATYSNPVGFVKVDMVEDAYVIIGIPMVVEDYALNDADDSVACAGEMLAENLNGGTSSTNAPNIYRYTGAGFESAFLFGGIPGHPLDGKWITGGGPSSMVLDSKTGYYLERQAADGGNPTDQAVILGDVEVGDSIDITIPVDYSMVAYPYPVDCPVNDASDSVFVRLSDGATGGTSTTNADVVYKYTGAGFTSAFLFGGIPGHPLDGLWITGGGPSTISFDPGEGFYYEAQAGFTWTVQRPFDLD